MQKDERDLLEVLRFELRFLEDGGYGRSPKTPWKPQYIFEDSLTCMNYDSKENPAPCGACVLMYLVPPESRHEQIPCRHIPFNASGETLESLYQRGNQQQTEETVADWLRATIARLEEDRMAVQRGSIRHPLVSGAIGKGDFLHQKQHPKCANPACPVGFRWTEGGKFFRFRPDPVLGNSNDAAADSLGAIHGVRHYWLCERCSQVFTLVYAEECGIVLKVLWPELPTVEAQKHRTAA